MSFQAGIKYFDHRPVGLAEANEILGSIATRDYPYITKHHEAGLFFAVANRRAGPRNSFISFDGRLDNRDDLRLQLSDDLSEDLSDTAIALAAYRRWGIPGFAHLTGDWSLAVWDAEQNAIILASDFAGVRPLYYCAGAGRVAWSTRLESLDDFTGSDEIDDDYAAALLSVSGFTYRTPYRGILSVPPGHAVRVTSDGAATHRFWTLPIANTLRYQRAAAYEEQLRGLFREAVRCRLPYNEPVAADLSGGLDSSSVVLMASRLREDYRIPPLTTVTMEHSKSLDTAFYTNIERLCETQPVHIATDEHRYVDEGLAGRSTPSPWQGMRTQIADALRNAGAHVYMTGQFGDFIMGNRWDDSAQVAGMLHRRQYSAALGASLKWSKTLRIPVYWVAWRALRSSLPARLMPSYLLNAKDGAYIPENNETSLTANLRKRVVAPDEGEPVWKDASPERRKHWYELWQILQSRMLQVPEPFEHLDYTHPYSHRPLVEFMMSIPAEVVCAPGEPRRLMRRAFAGLWPPELRRRRSKDSFGGVLMDSLRPLAAMFAQDPSCMQVIERGYVERKSLEERLNRLSNALECNEAQLQQIIMLELWLRDRTKRKSVKSLAAPVG